MFSKPGKGSESRFIAESMACITREYGTLSIKGGIGTLND
jgi:hypothetical protein